MQWGSHTLFIICPEGFSSKDRSSIIGRIETSYLNHFVMEDKFYNLVSNNLWFKGSAGFMFEMIVLSWLCTNSESKELACTPARSALPQLTIPVCQGWFMLSSKEQSNLGDLNECKRPFCMTVASKHGVKSTSFLQIANSLLKVFRKSQRWCHVFVTDKEASNRMASRDSPGPWGSK
ncbi:hypothetical protein B0F90DRAFT_1755457 [Multifurca ochricompacta]|uniref:Uncharacterized protein n=1 Tax=Multifurca ochricompacta TaxID=376703 RepID=A0AAD4LYP5_9AGAM|nr:hypothetical protein B0F90DRAFT_1755457 [Multifurca ochricompacta]